MSPAYESKKWDEGKQDINSFSGAPTMLLSKGPFDGLHVGGVMSYLLPSCILFC